MKMKHWWAAWILLASAGSGAFAQEGKSVEVKVGKDSVDFYVKGQLVTKYHTKGYAKPIFWPVYSPSRVALTRGWPMEKGLKGETVDHVHQKSAWFCHGDVIPQGITLKDKIKGVEGVDFWSENKGHGKMVCVHVGTPTVNGNKVSLVTRNEWQTSDGIKIMDETRVIHFVLSGDSYMIIVESELDGSVCDIVFGDTKEGSFGVRVNDLLAEAKNKQAKITNAEGMQGEKQCWGKISAWCDYSGPIEDKVAGIAILADPKNPHPTAWHSRGYGLMAANPFGRGHAGFSATKGRTDLVRLAKGEKTRFRYAILMHDGDAASAKVGDHFQRFVELRGK